MSALLFSSEGSWLFSRRVDLLVFGGSALLSCLLIALGAALDLLDADAPTWTWLLCVVAIDVAHVWSTGFRVYFLTHELRARPLLFYGVPLLAYLVGVALHAVGPLAFWRALAYLAVWHFVRQQMGFMRLYGRRNRAQTALDGALDQCAIVISMLYPLISWHAHLPRAFTWFVQGDFVADELVQASARAVLPAAQVCCVLALGAFGVRQWLLWRRGSWVPGKLVLVLATCCCWVLGIVVFDSDYAFTVSNIVLHGVPYFVLTHRYARAATPSSLARRIAIAGFVPFALVCIALALAEEALWDSLIWHEHVSSLGADFALSAAGSLFVVPLLAVPQVTHYVLDGLVWRVRRENPVLRRELESA